MFLILEIAGVGAVRLGAAARKVFDETGGTIGRLESSTWVLADPYVSGTHAIIGFANGAFLIEDTSTNGIFLNSGANRLRRGERRELHSGDRIIIEPYEIRVRVSLVPETWSSVPAQHECDTSGSQTASMPVEEPTRAVPPACASEGATLDPLRILGSVKSWFYEPDTPNTSSSPIQLRQARFAVFAPPRVTRGRPFLLQVWAFEPSVYSSVAEMATQGGRAEVLGSKGPISIEVGKTLTVTLTVPSFHIEPAVDSAEWDGKMANTDFVLCAEPNAPRGRCTGSAKIMSGDIPITVLKFELVVEQERQGEANPRPLEQEQIPIQNVFASYASEDRVDVLQWTRGAEFAGVNVFLDVLTLREGAAWETELQRHVPTKDLFCLFWSAPASRSRWVEMEWQCALATRGLDYIHPVALADPRVVPPPEQLRSRQFSDVSFVVREYEKGVQSDGSRNASSDHT